MALIEAKKTKTQIEQEHQHRLEEAVRLMTELDKAVDLKGQVKGLRDYLNSYRYPNSQPWRLVKISLTTKHRGSLEKRKAKKDYKTNGWPAGAAGYAHVQILAR